MFIGLDNVRDAISDLEKETNKSLKAIYTKGLSNIVAATPVHFKDGGRLRNSWNLSEGAPKGDDREPQGDAATQSYLSVTNKMPYYVLDTTLYFTNPMPYAEVVEYGGYPNPPKKGTNTGSSYQVLSVNGYSMQAPEGMVRINIEWMKSQIRKL